VLEHGIEHSVASVPEFQNASNIEISYFDIYDIRNWENHKSKDVVVEKGPTREVNLNIHADKYSMHFSYANYFK